MLKAQKGQEKIKNEIWLKPMSYLVLKFGTN